jgi:hypothetical protein
VTTHPPTYPFQGKDMSGKKDNDNSLILKTRKVQDKEQWVKIFGTFAESD